MADLVVTCTVCKKRFKPKTDVRGKKIKCPFCKEAFLVPAGKKAAKADPDVSEAIQSGDPSPERVTEQPRDEFDDIDPYAVKHQELVPRCPNCTTEMGEHDIICLACGYNTLTRQWGKTEKFAGITFGQQLLYLLPALGSAVFVFFSIIFLLYYDTVVPYQVAGMWLFWLDAESLRMWTTVIVLLWVFGAGIYCFKKFIEKPKPDAIAVESSSQGAQ